MGMLFRLLLCIAYMSISIGTPIYVNLLYFDIFFGPILILCAIRFHYTELSVSHLNDFQGCVEYESLLYYYTYFFCFYFGFIVPLLLCTCALFLLFLWSASFGFILLLVFLLCMDHILLYWCFGFYCCFSLCLLLLLKLILGFIRCVCVYVCVLIVFHLMLIISKRNHLFSLYSMAIRL